MNRVKIKKKVTFKQFQFFETPNSHFPHPHANHHIIHWYGDLRAVILM